jgi:hypothetical protein
MSIVHRESAQQSESLNSQRYSNSRKNGHKPLVESQKLLYLLQMNKADIRDLIYQFAQHAP